MAKHFLSCDWGTTHFRLRLVDFESLEILAEKTSGAGVARISQEADRKSRSSLFEETLLRHIKDLGRPVTEAVHCIVSGMASSRLGWIELPYAHAPLSLRNLELPTHTLPVSCTGHSLLVTLISGIRTACDIMRGEECELAGLLRLMPELACSEIRVIMPGTHSKHVCLKNGVIEDITTYMTGELYAQSRSLPTLQPCLGTGETFVENEFCQGVEASRAFCLSAALFKIRARALLQEKSDGLSFLSGVLIGSELRNLSGCSPLYLASSSQLAALYLLAAASLNVPLLPIPAATLRQAVVAAHRDLIPHPGAAAATREARFSP